ncbi:MAG: type II secretion system minor pseudopilin GspK [Leptothrix sp. (in: b-proteobacteria)]
MTRRQLATPAHARRSQRGAALLIAMIIVTLIATLATGMVWQQWRAVQVEIAERTQVQAQWILAGALDWARLILREDGRGSDIDHLGEPWAVPLAEARLSTFLAADKDHTAEEGMPDAFLSGAIRDAQARYNLRNLVRNGEVQLPDLKALQRLCALAGVAPSTADTLAEAVRLANPGNTAVITDTPRSQATTTVPVMPSSAADLGWLGIDALTVRRLTPFVTLLPGVTTVNLNTAPKEVIAALLDGVDLASAERLVQSRLRTPLRQVEDARAVLGAKAALDSARVGVSTRYFEVDGTMRLDQLVVAQRSLLERTPQTQEVRVIATRRLRAGEIVGNSLQQ